MCLNYYVLFFLTCLIGLTVCEPEETPRSASEDTLKTRFAELDKDQDGRLTPAEFKVAFDNDIDLAKFLVHLYDFDKDGSLSEKEFILAHRAEGDEKSFYEIMDKNKDGFVTREELTELFQESGVTDQHFINEEVNYYFEKGEIGPENHISKNDWVYKICH